MYEVVLFDGIFTEYTEFDSFTEAVAYIEATAHIRDSLKYVGGKVA